MDISEVVDWLEDYQQKHPDATTKFGWTEGGSYRGYYDEFSVEPSDSEVDIETMIGVLCDAIGQTFYGYKGGEYTMNESSEVYYAPYGNTGPIVSKALLRAIFEDPDFNYTDYE